MIPLDIQKDLTEAFIAQKPTSIVLTPRIRVGDGAGGHTKVDGPPRSPQTFTLIEPGDSGAQQPFASSDGSQYTLQFILIGAYDAVVAADDVFTLDGFEYKIVEVMPFNGYEQRAVVIRHGF